MPLNGMERQKYLEVKFNGFKSQNYISPSADLVRLDTNPFSNKNWILPLKKI